MISRRKNIIIGLGMVLTLFIIVSVTTSIKPPIVSEPRDFYATSKKVSFEEMIEIANKLDISIFLPESFPKDLLLTAVYLKESPFIAILVYSTDGNIDYKSAELTIEISPVDPIWIPSFADLQSEAEKSNDKTAIKVNDWPVLIQENADMGGNSEQIEKYGETTLLINAWIEGVSYLYNAPTLNVQAAMLMLESTKLIN